MTLHLNGTGDLDDALRAVTEQDAQVVVEREGVAVAVLVSPRYLEAFNALSEEIENRLDADAYHEAKQAFVDSGEPLISYQEFRKALGL